MAWDAGVECEEGAPPEQQKWNITASQGEAETGGRGGGHVGLAGISPPSLLITHSQFPRDDLSYNGDCNPLQPVPVLA